MNNTGGNFARLGITGPRGGLTPLQLRALGAALNNAHVLGVREFHHGDCIGADVIGAQIAHDLGMTVVGHPPINPNFRAFFPSDITHAAMDYLERDRALVDAVIHGDRGAILGFPDPARSKGGTWYTVRYARYRQAPLLCVAPQGLVIDHYKVDSIYPLTTHVGVTTDLRTVHEEPA